MNKIKKEVKKAESAVETKRKELGVVSSVEDMTKNIFDKLFNTTHPKNTRKLTLGERAADALATWAGSWTFILGFALFLIFWMLINVYAWINTWDPYPFILLNLVLSCLAAIQAPVILMSQNRQTQKDRLRAEYDYSVNRKAERQIQDIKKQLNRLEKKMPPLKEVNSK